MNKVKTCFICENPTPDGVYNVKQHYVCRLCLSTYTNLYVDDFTIENGEVVSKNPFEGMDEAEQKEICIQYAYTLFNQKLATRAFPLFNNYRNKKNFTWLGMIRALEWFYIVKGNNVTKAKNSIGIVPFVYDEAQKYYEKANAIIKQRYKQQILPATQKEDEVIEVKVERKAKADLFDLGGL